MTLSSCQTLTPTAYCSTQLCGGVERDQWWDMREKRKSNQQQAWCLSIDVRLSVSPWHMHLWVRECTDQLFVSQFNWHPKRMHSNYPPHRMLHMERRVLCLRMAGGEKGRRGKGFSGKIGVKRGKHWEHEWLTNREEQKTLWCSFPRKQRLVCLTWHDCQVRGGGTIFVGGKWRLDREWVKELSHSDHNNITSLSFRMYFSVYFRSFPEASCLYLRMKERNNMSIRQSTLGEDCVRQICVPERIKNESIPFSLIHFLSSRFSFPQRLPISIQQQESNYLRPASVKQRTGET